MRIMELQQESSQTTQQHYREAPERQHDGDVEPRIIQWQSVERLIDIYEEVMTQREEPRQASQRLRERQLREREARYREREHTPEGGETQSPT